MIPLFIKNRIIQPATFSEIVLNSIPIVFFGNIETAKVATLSLNPSDKEFLNKKGDLLTGSTQRLESLISLGASSLSSLSEKQIVDVYNSCLTYFSKKNAKPYNTWFSSMESLIKDSLGISYYNGSCCHLDIIQWATIPTWSGLPKHVIDGMLKNDLPFFKELITNSKIELILLNGATTLREFKNIFEKELIEITQIVETKNENQTVKLEKGSLKIDKKKFSFIGWNLYRQQAIKKENVAAIVKKIKEEYEQFFTVTPV